DPSQARKTLGLGEQDRVVSIVARLYPEKRHELLLRAFSRVMTEVPHAKLLIVGDGIEKKKIADMIAQRNLQEGVLLLGVRSDIPVILAASDVAVLCSER